MINREATAYWITRIAGDDEWGHLLVLDIRDVVVGLID